MLYVQFMLILANGSEIFRVKILCKGRLNTILRIREMLRFKGTDFVLSHLGD